MSQITTLNIPMSQEHRLAVVIGCNSLGRSIQSYAPPVLEAACDLAERGAELGQLVRQLGEQVDHLDIVSLIELVDRLKQRADPHPARRPLTRAAIEALAHRLTKVLTPMIALRASAVEQELLTPPPPVQDEVFLSLRVRGDLRERIKMAAGKCGVPAYRFAGDNLVAAAHLSQFAAVVRKLNERGDPRFDVKHLVGTWDGLLESTRVVPPEKICSHQGLQDELLQWYQQAFRDGYTQIEWTFPEKEEQG